MTTEAAARRELAAAQSRLTANSSALVELLHAAGEELKGSPSVARRRELENAIAKVGDDLGAGEPLVSMSMFKATLARIAQAVVQHSAPLRKRLDELESNRGGGITIRADNVSVPGMAGVSKAVAKLNATLLRPVAARYDERGIVIGAERVNHLPGGEPAGTALADVEARLAAIEAKGANGGDDSFDSTFSSRLAAVETRTGALSMLLAKGEGAGKLAALEALEARIRALESK